MTQSERILRHLQDYGSITPVEALSDYGCMRLGECDGVARMDDGWIKVRINGKWYACHETRVVLVEVE